MGLPRIRSARGRLRGPGGCAAVAGAGDEIAAVSADTAGRADRQDCGHGRRLGAHAPGDDPVAARLVLAIRGETPAPSGASSRMSAAGEGEAGPRGGTMTPLHLITEWPGYLPGGPEIVRLLIGTGADPDAVTSPVRAETPLHWVASSNDCDVASALIDGDADIEKLEGSIETPLDNAVGYSCWHVGPLLADTGATVG